MVAYLLLLFEHNILDTAEYIKHNIFLILL